ncbi:MAG: UvrD-helicase domain-containing protein [Eubacteriales bacterium]|nr:UvrD-helicase domain-containing protein [Eubacteriales bacterium]
MQSKVQAELIEDFFSALNERQKAAVFAPADRDIILDAGAGSGKTRVLSSRVIKRLVAGEVEPDQLLVVTFTEKAAASMKQKIEAELEAMLQATPDPDLRKSLRELRERLPLATISTMHAFCWRLVKEQRAALKFKEQLRISEKTLVMDQAEEDDLLFRTLDELLAEKYRRITAYRLGSQEEAFTPEEIAAIEADIRLFNSIDTQQDDQGLKEQLAADYGLLRSLPDYLEAAEKALGELGEKSQNLALQDWFTEALSLVNQKLPQELEESSELPALSALLRALIEIESDPYLNDWRAKRAKAKEYQKLESLLAELNALRGDLEDLAQRLQGASLAGAEGKAIWNELHELGSNLAKLDVIAGLSRGNEEKLALRELYGSQICPFLQLLTGAFAPGSTMSESFGLEFYGSYFTQSYEELAELHLAAYERAKNYIQLLAELDDKYKEAKLRAERVDYNDFEHLAAELLKQPEIALTLSQQYREIYIDEYQDTSPLQDALIERLAKADPEAPSCRFMVGDVKQSIYRFRHAAPALFQARAELYQNSEEAGRYLILTENYRSRPEILDFVNQVFSAFMRQATAEIDYDSSQRLRFGERPLDAGSGAALKPEIRLRLLYTAEPEAEAAEADVAADGAAVAAAVEAAAQEAAVEAGQNQLGGLAHPFIREIAEHQEKARHEALLVVDEIFRLREAGREFSDIIVLCRSNAEVNSYANVLKDFDIPLATVRKIKIDSQQLLFLTSFLELLANPLQDLPLLAYLRSYLHGRAFQEAELLEIANFGLNLAAKDSLPSISRLWFGPFFYEQVARYRSEGPETELRERLDLALTKLETWREELSYRPYCEVLEEILLYADYREYLALLDSDGAGRLADLELFLEWVKDAWQKGQSLLQLMRKVVRLREESMEIEDSEQEASAVGRVRLMTIHKSKGLEAKVIIMGRASKAFERNASYPPFVFSTEPLSIAPLAWNEKTDQRIRLADYKKAQEVEAKKDLAEEYRLLYVALTRAEEELCIIGRIHELERSSRLSDKDKWLNFTNKLSKLQFKNYELGQKDSGKEVEGQILESDLDRLGNNLELILASLKRDFEAQNQELTFSEFLANYFQPGQLQEALISEKVKLELTELEKLTRDLDNLMSRRNENTGLKLKNQAKYSSQEIARSLELAELRAAKIPHTELLSLPSKLTVTELTKREFMSYRAGQKLEAEEASEPSTELPGLREMALKIEPLESALKPDQKRAMNAREYGIFLHKIFQHFKVELLEPQAELSESEFTELLEAEFKVWAEHALLRPDEVEVLKEAGEKARVIAYLYAFYQSDFCRELVRAKQIEREIPFTLSIPASEFMEPEARESYSESVGDSDLTLVQGMIDLFYVNQAGEAILLDYKSDQIRGSQAEQDAELIKRYREQLRYYRLAIERISKKPVKAAYLWLIRAGRALEISFHS